MIASERLLDRSIAATLSAIEIYNKPSFAYREEVFSILVINGWELLLKAKIVRDSGESLSSILAVDKEGAPKKSRSGADLTIDISRSMSRVNLDTHVSENLSFLVELRDAATHLYCDDDVKYVVYALGAACLRNYQRCCSEWFGRSLNEYNFYILPLAFSYSFKTLSLIDVSSKAESVTALLKAVEGVRSELGDADSNYDLICEIKTQLVSAKKIVDGDGGLILGVDNAALGRTPISIRYQAPIDKYPLSYVELESHVKAARPGTKQGEIQAVLKKHGVKSNALYSAYNFRTRAHKERFEKTGKLPKDLAVIYNEDAVSFIVSMLGDI